MNKLTHFFESFILVNFSTKQLLIINDNFRTQKYSHFLVSAEALEKHAGVIDEDTVEKESKNAIKEKALV